MLPRSLGDADTGVREPDRQVGAKLKLNNYKQKICIYALFFLPNCSTQISMELGIFL